MLKRLLILLVVLAVLIGGFVWFKQQQAQQAAAMMAPPPPAVVTATEVRSQIARPSLQATGTLVAVKGVELSAEVDGIVREIAFQSGQAVKQGDLLLRLDDEVDRADLQGARASLELARLKFDRFKRLLRDKSVSQSDYDTAQAELSSARAAVAAKQATIDRKTLRAPFDGVLGIEQISLGQYLAKGSPIVPLVQLDPVHVDFSLPERQLPQLAVGQQVSISVAAWPQAFSGEVIAIDPDVAVDTRQVRVRARLSNPQGQLRPGMFARVGIDLGREEPVLTLPRVAITYAPYGDSVYVIEQADDKLTVQQRQVTSGVVIGDRVVISEGLSEGEQVVLTGQVKLRNGAAVQIDNRIAPADAGAAAQ